MQSVYFHPGQKGEWISNDAKDRVAAICFGLALIK